MDYIECVIMVRLRGPANTSLPREAHTLATGCGRMMENRVQLYLDEVMELRTKDAISLVSVILFGSAASDAFSQSSDVDLIIVVPDETSPENRCLLRAEVTELETMHGLRLPESSRKKPLEGFAEHAVGHAHSCFLCTRVDLISGDVARIFGLRGAEEVFLERMFFASVIVSAKTVWGEDLLSLVPLPSLRRRDVFKSLFRSTAFILFCAAAFPVLYDATRYAMGALKHSLHSCYLCYHLRTAPLDEEVAFFNSRLGRDRVLQDLLNQRRQYHRSFAFVLRCVPILFRLHLRTLRDNRFPRTVARS
jgi:predicted nucleotidyltransferase